MSVRAMSVPKMLLQQSGLPVRHAYERQLVQTIGNFQEERLTQATHRNTKQSSNSKELTVRLGEASAEFENHEEEVVHHERPRAS
jgi:hypothetical protein